ncbi:MULTISPECIES: carbonic anhydrase [Acidobacteriaceae]|uniref:carbonic anhydrase n=1 Tax=Acidobacteriaceae TaxID=204434 RepID=UPI00131C4F2E|nr:MULTISPECIES: carbonic anhydrase [Acidobacteriaceae]MDW5267807.1 carbonic anhydrase [Edaphobacter sp.]
MQDVLEQLKAGVRRFQATVYPEQAEMYRKAVSVPQEPHTLFVACADSRIEPETITQTKPGEMFVLRNIGNLIPAYGEMMGGVSAVVEYAVSLLKVKHVVVCGHADCGAMKGLLNPDSVTTMPAVKNWLKNAATAMSVAEALGARDEAPETLMRSVTEQNVLLQIQHLRTHPSVAAAIAREELTISGWVYEIGTGQVRISEDGAKSFVPVSGAA